ncbi:hypothetical protein ACFQ0D_37305, partial [Micromonospora zhanjiangensis]
MANASIEVTPSTVEPGTRVDLRADCADGNNRQASAESDAFGRVVLRPGNGALTGSVTVPGNKQPGTYQVNLTCQNGNNASTNLIVVNMSKPSQGPATGGGGTAGGMSGPLVIAGGAGRLGWERRASGERPTRQPVGRPEEGGIMRGLTFVCR